MPIGVFTKMLLYYRNYGTKQIELEEMLRFKVKGIVLRNRYIKW